MLGKILDQLIKSDFMFTFLKEGDLVKLSYYQGESIGEPIIQGTVEDCIKALCEENPGLISADDYLRLNARQQEKLPDAVEDMSIDHPFFSEFKKILSASLQNAVHYTDQNTTAIISTKIEVNEANNAPDFANDAKLISPVKFSVGMSTKRDFQTAKGCSKEFVARTVDGHMVLVSTDRQMSLEEIEAKVEEVDDMDEDDSKDAFFDPDNAVEGEVNEYHAGDENQIGIEDIKPTDPEKDSDTDEEPNF